MEYVFLALVLLPVILAADKAEEWLCAHREWVIVTLVRVALGLALLIGVPLLLQVHPIAAGGVAIVGAAALVTNVAGMIGNAFLDIKRPR